MAAGDLAFRILGPVEAATGDHRLPLTAVKQRALLAALLIDANRVVPSDALVDALWGDDPPASVAVTLRSLVSRLRRVLDSAGDGSVALVASAPGYVLRVDPARVDSHRFEQLTADGRAALGRGDPTAAAAALRAGLALWHGPALADLAGDLAFARAEADRLDEVRRAAVEDLADAELALLQRLDDEARHNLPEVLSRFVGRESERRRVAELVGNSRLVTLTGAGGVGKTRLSVEVARSLLPSFPDGVFFVDLAPVTDPSVVALQLVSVLGLALGSEQATPSGVVDRLAEHLGRRRVLLVFDNCEHLVAPVRALVDPLLRRCPPLAVLATSRERLSVTGESVWRVPSLSETDAVALFCDRARALDADFSLDDRNAADVTRICRRLDGIPLAIELATARLGVLGPAEIAERLDDRLRLLTKGSATAPTRHQTLRACMEWGYDLLDEPERTVLRRLSVFADRFDHDAAEAVAGDAGGRAGPEMLDVLSRLVDTCWVSIAAGRDGTRFRLMETVKQFAAEALAAAGEDEAMLRRHRDHFLVVAGGYLGFPSCAPRGWMAKVSADYENLRSALEWSWRTGDTEQSLWLAGRLFALWAMDGRFSEGAHWLERVVEAPAGAAGPARVWALVGLGVLTSFVAGSAEGLGFLRSASELAGTIDDRLGGAHADGFLAAMAIQSGQAATAVADLAGVRERFDAEGFPAGVAWCDHHVGWATFGSDPLAAASAFERAMEVGTREGRDILTTQAAAARASLAARQGDHRRAIDLAGEAVDAARRLDLRYVLLMALTRQAEVTALAGELARAAGPTREALRLIRDAGGQTYVPDLLQLAALVLEERGETATAARLLSAGRVVGGAGTADRPSPLQEAGLACRTRLTAILGKPGLAAEENVGLVISAEDAVDEALAALEPGWTPWAPTQRERKTFMFTDIVGSTQLASALGDGAWTGLLSWHDETLRRLFAVHGGEEVKHTGDGFFVAFDDAARGVGCAVAIHAALVRPAAATPELVVRIGLHETEASRKGGDYHGRGIHETARIAALAGPGEILVSAATANSLPGFALSEPRTLALKGIPDPVEVVSVDRATGSPAPTAR